jgi:hypothetical protein
MSNVRFGPTAVKHVVRRLQFTMDCDVFFCRMASSGMLRCVALVRTDDSEDRSASIIGVTISLQRASVASYG